MGSCYSYQVWGVCGLLVLAVGLLFGQTVCYEFVNYDDGDYVYDNPPVSHGLSGPGIVWAFTRPHAGYWIPLTWLSLMVDCQLYGLHSGGHHLTNVLLHAATAILLFLVLWRMTSGLWPSALVAAIFAVHPLHVESVAWVTERKDVLSGLFFMLTLGAYLGYVRHRSSVVRYLAVMLFFALGIMAKPALVTVPFVLLLLDYWPLGRTGLATARDAPVANDGPLGRFRIPIHHLVVEKLPLLVLAVIFCMVTVWTQGATLTADEHLPFSWRIANALVAYVTYLGQFFYPLGLAVFYPHPGPDLPAWKVVGALVVLACIFTVALVCCRRRPYFLMGWLWYVGMLAPMIGLLQAGEQAMADRFTYLAQIGLCIALAWAVADSCGSWSCRRWVCGVASALVLAVLMGCAWRQASFWRDSETLWTHAVACTSRNILAHNNLATILGGQGRIEEAIVQYRKALESQPDDAVVLNNLGVALARRGQVDEAMGCYYKALEIKPDYAKAHFNLGNALAGRGRWDDALAHYQKAVEIQPDLADAHINLGNALSRRGRFDEALAHYQKAVELSPDLARAHCDYGYALARRGRLDEALAEYGKALKIEPNLLDAHNALGVALCRMGRPAEALTHYRKALDIKPDDAEAHNNLAWLRATCPVASLRNGDEAMELAQRANQLCGGRRADVLDTLAATYAEAGWFPEALATARKARELATQQNNHVLAEALRARIALYKAGRPYRQTPSSSALLPLKP